MKGFIDDIEERTEGNTDFRRVLYTGPRLQLVVMALEPGEELGEEIHQDTDQFFRIEEGKGEVVMDGRSTYIKSDMGIVVPAGTKHNIVNTGPKPLKFYTIYAPPHHADGTVHRTKSDAEKPEAHASR